MNTMEQPTGVRIPEQTSAAGWKAAFETEHKAVQKIWMIVDPPPPEGIDRTVTTDDVVRMVEKMKADLDTFGKDTVDTENRIIDAEFAAQSTRTAIINYLAVFDRCGGSEAVAAEEFADARQALRDAVQQKAGTE